MHRLHVHTTVFMLKPGTLLHNIEKARATQNVAKLDAAIVVEEDLELHALLGYAPACLG